MVKLPICCSCPTYNIIPKHFFGPKKCNWVLTFDQMKIQPKKIVYCLQREKVIHRGKYVRPEVWCVPDSWKFSERRRWSTLDRSPLPRQLVYTWDSSLTAPRIGRRYGTPFAAFTAPQYEYTTSKTRPNSVRANPLVFFILSGYTVHLCLPVHRLVMLV